MISMLVGRAAFASSSAIRAGGASKCAQYALHQATSTGQPINHGFKAFNLFQQQSTRFISKSNGSFARFGTKERAVPIRSAVEHAGTMHSYGLITLSAAGVMGVGALCYYGLGMSNAEGALDRAVIWPQYVRDRIQSTYSYLGTGFGISAAAAYATFKSPAAMRFFSNGGIMFMIGSMAALIGSSVVVQSLPYEPGFGTKQLAWAGHCSILGMLLAPCYILGGPAIIRAAAYTAGIVGGLSAIAVCAPSERFLVSTAPLSMGLGAIVASSIGSLLLGPTSKVGLGLYGISLYGGVLVFGGLLLYDTQKTIKKAELHPAYTMAPYDPINNSLHIYMDIINIFVRMLQIFGGGQRK